MEGLEEGVGTADLGIGGGMADLRLKAFSGSASFVSLLPGDGDGDMVDASVSICFTRPPDALISLSKALNPAGRVGGGIGAEAEEGGGGGGTDLRWSFSSSSFCFFSSLVWLFSPFTRPPDALISLKSALNPAGRLGGIDEEEEDEEAEEGGIGMADLGIGGGPLGFRRSFDSFDSFDSSSLLVPSTLNSFTRPPDALISLSKALNPAGRVGGGIGAEAEEEGKGGGGTDLRLSFSPFSSSSSSSSFCFFSSSVWLLSPFTRPPDALISLSKALNTAGRLGGIDEEEEEEEEGIADTGTGGGMDVPRTESLTDEDGSGGGCFETAGEGTTGAMEDTTRLDSIEVLLHLPAEGRTR